MRTNRPYVQIDPDVLERVRQIDLLSYLIRRLAETRNTTMVIVTHEIAFAEKIADRIIYMNHGDIVEEGPTRQILSDPKEEETRKFLNHSLIYRESN